jgi:hypothetical protein
MASVISQLMEEVTAHAQSDSLEDAREIRADGTYFLNNPRTCLHTVTVTPSVCTAASADIHVVWTHLYNSPTTKTDSSQGHTNYIEQPLLKFSHLYLAS